MTDPATPLQGSARTPQTGNDSRARAKATPPRKSRQAPPTAGSSLPGRRMDAADGSTFAPAMRLLPPELRADVETLYRVLRTLDDLVDEDDPRAPERVGAVERWARHEPPGRQPPPGHPPAESAPECPTATPETRALSALARRRRLPRPQILHFCAGMRHDIARARIDTEADFMRYCQQAGGSVGVVLANLLDAEGTHGRGDSPAELGMAALGRAMQITNILRDIDEDLAHGRLYIPQSSIRSFGPPAPGVREGLARQWIPRADALYEEGAAAIPLLRGGSEAMALSARLYRGVLRQIERGFGAPQHERQETDVSRPGCHNQ